MTRLLSSLEPITEEKIRRLIAASAAVGLEVYVVTAYRTYPEQDALFSQGRTSPGNKVTNARGGESWHNFGRAVDLAFEDEMGKPDWDRPMDQWKLLGAMGEMIGLEWGGKFEGLGDYGHFHYSAGMTKQQAKASWESNQTLAKVEGS